MDGHVGEIARRQHGIVARSQLVAAGFAGNTIDLRVRSGRLHTVYPGVYAVGHAAITQRGRWMAAVLASGPGAVLSHRSAAALWGIWGSGTGEIHVTVPRKTRSARSIRRHFSVLPPDECEVNDDIPVTSAARAVLDLAAEKGEAAAERALREMEYLEIRGALSLPVLIARHPRHPGRQLAEVCLERLKEDPNGRIRSGLEESFLPFLDAHRIQRPHLNAWIEVDDDRFQVDCLWTDAHLIRELDDFHTHGSLRSFRGDRRRDRRFGAAGYQVVRITRDQIRDEPDDVAVDLQTTLASRTRLPRTTGVGEALYNRP